MILIFETGTEISNNSAVHGGGYFVNQYNDNFVVISTNVYENTYTLQSEHPYTSLSPVDNVAQIIFNQTITIDNADDLTIIFDAQSKLSGKRPINYCITYA